MVKTLGIFADFPKASTGMAVVCHNMARELAKKGKLRVIYFGRFGRPDGIAPEEETSLYSGYEYVPCEGGVWKTKIVEKAIKLYKLDLVFSEDDWWSAQGLITACKRTKTPLHFLTPIDSLPIHKDAFKVFEACEKVYVPNSAYKLIPDAVELKHGVNTLLFQPLKANKQRRIFEKFTFLWIGRNETRKAMGRAILAFKSVYEKMDNCQMVIRSDWGTEWGRKTLSYLIKHRELPIIRDQTKDVPHGYMQEVYANCDVLVVTSKAGGFELQSIEAMACGLPVLCTDFTFMNEQIVNGKNGFLIPTSEIEPATPNGRGRLWGCISVEALAKKMLWCAQNKKKAKNMGNWARKHVMENYSWEKAADILYGELGL